eukprot:164536-Amphidinium_carterae.2
MSNYYSLLARLVEEASNAQICTLQRYLRKCGSSSDLTTGSCQHKGTKAAQTPDTAELEVAYCVAQHCNHCTGHSAKDPTQYQTPGNAKEYPTYTQSHIFLGGPATLGGPFSLSGDFARPSSYRGRVAPVIQPMTPHTQEWCVFRAQNHHQEGDYNTWARVPHQNRQTAGNSALPTRNFCRLEQLQTHSAKTQQTRED